MMYVTVADMIRALAALPADARLVVTHDGYYCYDDFGDCFVPVPAGADSDGTRLYAIGNSTQYP